LKLTTWWPRKSCIIYQNKTQPLGTIKAIYQLFSIKKEVCFIFKAVLLYYKLPVFEIDNLMTQTTVSHSSEQNTTIRHNIRLFISCFPLNEFHFHTGIIIIYQVFEINNLMTQTTVPHSSEQNTTIKHNITFFSFVFH
jgi:hypothetical protein